MIDNIISCVNEKVFSSTLDSILKVTGKNTNDNNITNNTDNADNNNNEESKKNSPKKDKYCNRMILSQYRDFEEHFQGNLFILVIDNIRVPYY
jgi:hypothetical protein